MSYSRLIDMHTHFFNNKFLPIGEFMRHNWGLPRKAALKLGEIFNNLTGRPVPEPYPDDDEWVDLAAREEDPDFYASVLTALIQETLRSDDFGRDSKDRGWGPEQLLEAAEGLLKTYCEETSQESGAAKLVSALRRANQEDVTDEDQKSLDELWTALKNNLRKTKGGAAFLIKMMSSTDTLSDHLLNKNYQADNAPCLTIHIAMDMEPSYWERNDPCSTVPPEFDYFSEQMKQFAEHTTAARGRLLGLVNFHPQRGEEGLERCWQALQKGNIGFKLYPPLGFRGDDYDRFPVLKLLYERCQAQGVPIMAHCRTGEVQAWKGTGRNADPDHWIRVLDDFPGLRFCFAHAGGGRDTYYKEDCEEQKVQGWYSDEQQWQEDSCYPRKVMEHCISRPHVYTDMSYLHELIDNEDNERGLFVANLLKGVGQGAAYPIFDKIIYGSDWHMNGLIGRTQKYYETFKDIFHDNQFGQDNADKFFFRNAVAFLNLPGYLDRDEAADEPFLSEAARDHLRAIINMAQQES